MTTTKIKIDLSQGIVEAEGSESFVLGVYSDFKDKLSQELHPSSSKSTPSQPSQPSVKKKSTTKKKSTPKKKSGAKGDWNIISDLDLSGKGSSQSLKEFYNQYSVKTNFERNLIFVYYLQNILKISGITIDHIFTCYRNVPKLKIPGNLKQSLFDTAFKKDWIDTTSTENIHLTVTGTNHLEHDMPLAEGMILNE